MFLKCVRRYSPRERAAEWDQRLDRDSVRHQGSETDFFRDLWQGRRQHSGLYKGGEHVVSIGGDDDDDDDDEPILKP